jgi:hypothetical protein
MPVENHLFSCGVHEQIFSAVYRIEYRKNTPHSFAYTYLYQNLPQKFVHSEISSSRLRIWMYNTTRKVWIAGLDECARTSSTLILSGTALYAQYWQLLLTSDLELQESIIRLPSL